MALGLLCIPPMGTTVALVYQYRQLNGRCDAGEGLDFDEIDTLTTVESMLAQPPIGVNDWRTIAASGDASESFAAVLRGPRMNDDVAIVNLGPQGCVCRNAPYAEEGVTVELVIADSEAPVSYRFKAQVTWLDDDGDDFVMGLEFVGVPLQVRYATSREMAAVSPPDHVAAA
jgi:hypothetical protein